MNKISILALLLFISASTLQAKESPWAKVTLVQGSAAIVGGSDSGHAIAIGDKLSEGAIIKTEAKSVVRLKLADKSTLNIAPSSQIELKAVKADEPALWILVAGSIRALIKKSETQDKEKLIIRAGTAAIGIRGTDFSVSFDAATNKTSLVTIQGSVAMANVGPGMSASEALRSDNAVLVKTGQTSQLVSGAAKPSAPQSVPSNQMQRLQKNSSSMPNSSQQSNGKVGNGPQAAGPDNSSQGGGSQQSAPRGGNNGSMMSGPGGSTGSSGGQSSMPSPNSAPAPQSLGSSSMPAGPSSGGGTLPPPPTMNGSNTPPPAVSQGTAPNQSVGGATVGGGLQITPNKPGGLPNGKPPGK